jgi:hypothetical protein
MGKLKMAGSAFNISGYPRSPSRPPAPNLDEARTAILEELDLPGEEPRTRTKKPPGEAIW